MLDLKNITVKAEGKEILKNITYTFKENTVYAIMGPNGSGKSTLAHSIMSNPVYQLVSGQIIYNNVDITELDVSERAKKGIFLSFQQPLSLSGVRPYELLRMGHAEGDTPIAIRKRAQNIADELQISKELLSRNLNENASGGERKKLEILQAFALQKDTIIFDEIDTGVDVDAMKTIGTFLEKNKAGKTYIIITHYNRILDYIKPDIVLVLQNGQIIKEGNANLAKNIEMSGYNEIIK